MSVLTAVETVLAEVGAPLHYCEITRRIVERGLWTPEGKTPEATVRGAIGVEIKNRGNKSRFQRVDKGLFALCGWAVPEIASKREQTKSTPAPEEKKLTVTSVRTISFTDAAEQVLDQFGGKRPMHYRDIAKKVLELGLVRTEGRTPEATLYAQISTEIARKTRRGDASRFVKHGKGFVGLSRWMARGLVFQIEQHNNAARKKLHTRLMAMSPPEFEALIGKLLVAIGFDEVSVTGRSGDGGIDVRGTLVVGDVIRTRMDVQVKRWKPNVQAPTVQQVRGSLGAHEQGLIITTSEFSTGARSEAERSNAVPVALMNGERLLDLLVEHEIGVHHTSSFVIGLGVRY